MLCTTSTHQGLKFCVHLHQLWRLIWRLGIHICTDWLGRLVFVPKSHPAPESHVSLQPIIWLMKMQANTVTGLWSQQLASSEISRSWSMVARKSASSIGSAACPRNQAILICYLKECSPCHITNRYSKLKDCVMPYQPYDICIKLALLCTNSGCATPVLSACQAN